MEALKYQKTVKNVKTKRFNNLFVCKEINYKNGAKISIPCIFLKDEIKHYKDEIFLNDIISVEITDANASVKTTLHKVKYNGIYGIEYPTDSEDTPKVYISIYALLRDERVKINVLGNELYSQFDENLEVY